jgi:hypothetical protein
MDILLIALFMSIANDGSHFENSAWNTHEVLNKRTSDKHASLLKKLEESEMPEGRSTSKTVTIWKLCGPGPTWRQASFTLHGVEFSVFVLAASLVEISPAEATAMKNGPFKANITAGWHIKAGVLVQVSANHLETHRKYDLANLDHYSIIKQDYDIIGALKRSGVVCSFGKGGKEGANRVKQQSQSLAMFVEQEGDAVYLFCRLDKQAGYSKAVLAAGPPGLQEGVPFDVNLTFTPAEDKGEGTIGEAKRRNQLRRRRRLEEKEKGSSGEKDAGGPADGKASVLQLQLCSHTMPKRKIIWCSNALESMSCGFSSKVREQCQHTSWQTSWQIGKKIRTQVIPADS